MEFESTFGTSKPIIGMVHLSPLPGSPGYEDGIEAVCERAVADATALEAGGVDGLMLENFGDTPYYPETVPPHTVAAMTRTATGEAVAAETLSVTRDRHDEDGLDVPILIGSGVDTDSVWDLLGGAGGADGAIVGTAFKQSDETTAPVSEKRVRTLIERAEATRLNED